MRISADIAVHISIESSFQGQGDEIFLNMFQQRMYVPMGEQ